MKVTTVTITPDKAKELLAGNTTNRTISPTHVSRLAREMKSGRWKFNGDTICINGSRLIDGQHRLSAVVESGVAIQTLLVEGLPDDVFDTKDVGKKRSGADTLSVRGEVNCTLLAATLAAIDRYVTGRADSKGVVYSNTEMEGLLAKYPEARESVRICMHTSRIIPSSILAAGHYLFSRKEKEMADAFVTSVVSGRNLSEGDAVFVLRERLIQNSLSKAKLSPGYMFALLIKAWNARRAGLEVKQLKYVEAGKTPEKFPVVI